MQIPGPYSAYLPSVLLAGDPEPRLLAVLMTLMGMGDGEKALRSNAGQREGIREGLQPLDRLPLVQLTLLCTTPVPVQSTLSTVQTCRAVGPAPS
jgi:hypothetical protein